MPRQPPQKERDAMRVVIQEDYRKMCKWAADYIATRIKAHREDRPFVLGLPTGSSPIGVYQELVRQNRVGELSFANVVTFNMDEYLGLPREHDQSYWYFMHDNFFNHLTDMKPENINILNGMTDDPEGECARYEEKIASYGGIDLFLGGIGVDGHIAFNEPYTSLASRTGVRDLTTDTRIVNSRFFGNDPDWIRTVEVTVRTGCCNSFLPYSAPLGQLLPVTAKPFSSSTLRWQPLGQVMHISSVMPDPPPRSP